VRFFEHFEEATGYPADFRQHGYLMIATCEEEVAQFQKNLAAQHACGVPSKLISPAEVHTLVPALRTEDVIIANYCPTDGYADPNSVVQGFARAGKAMGVKILEETEVTGLKVTKCKVTGVETGTGLFPAKTVIIAAGAWSNQIGEAAGIKIPVSPCRRHIFVTEPVTKVKRDLPMIVEFKTGFWIRSEGRNLIFGMRNNAQSEGYDTSIDWDFFTEYLAPVAIHRFPILENTGIARAQAGLHEDTTDANAILGEVPGIGGLFLACGFSGHGFMHSPAIGSLITHIILNHGIGEVNVEFFSIRRFNQPAISREKLFI